MSSIDGTLIIEATADAQDLDRRLAAVDSSDAANRIQRLVVNSEPVRATGEILQQVLTSKIAFLPAGASFNIPPFYRIDERVSIAPWILDTSLDPRVKQIGGAGSISWVAPTELLRKLPDLRFPSEWNIFDLERRLRESKQDVVWASARSTEVSEQRRSSSNGTTSLNHASKVLALVPHYKAEEWLANCLLSLVSQTRPVDGIAVIDDASPNPPTEIVKQFPHVTLFTAEETSGPFRLKQEIIDTTDYDAYLFQDADDWSANDRLELLLNEAERTGAEIVGSQEVRVYCDSRGTVPVSYPLDASWDACEDPVLHPTTLVARKIIDRIGGFATGLRFGGDVEFQIRASCVARMANVPDFCYFRRRHVTSLTMAPATGIGSPARRKLQDTLKQQSAERMRLRAAGQEPSLLPEPVAPRIKLTHLLGPELHGH